MGDLNRYCNQCGKVLNQGNRDYGEEVFHGYKEWGYFSNKDLEIHEFLLCESCYDRMIRQFTIPVHIKMKTEVMNEKE